MYSHCDILHAVSAQAGRRWPDDLKVQIVAETLVPHAQVYDVERAYGIRANRISEWRMLAKKSALVLPPPPIDARPQFTQLLIDPLPKGNAGPADCAMFEIVKGDVVIRLTGDTSALRIAQIAGAWSSC